MSPRRPRAEEDDEVGDDQPEARRMRRLPSFPSVIREVVFMEAIQRICSSLEPIIRTTVHEEVERCISQHLHLLPRAPALRVDAPPARLELAFARPLSLPVFTNNKLVDGDGNPLEIRLLDAKSGHPCTPRTHQLVSGTVLRLEVVALDGDFGGEFWTSDEFSGAVVRAREGRRPLLVGTLTPTLNDRGVAVVRDVCFTDNSSWIRSRRFRLGVRVQAAGSSSGSGIREAVSESFTVKDHRGEVYKKNFPPSLGDDTWRLKNIGKDGPIHRRLEAEGINTVQNFLKLHTTDPERLKSILGMPDRLWRSTIDHARTCDMGGKSYLFKSQRFGVTLMLSPIGEVLGATLGHQMCPLQELLPHQIVLVKKSAQEACQNWDQLEEVANESEFSANNRCQAPGDPDSAQTLLYSSCRQPGEGQESVISSGSRNTKYLDKPTGIGASNVKAPHTVDSDDTGAAHSAICWSPGAEADSFDWEKIL